MSHPRACPPQNHVPPTSSFDKQWPVPSHPPWRGWRGLGADIVLGLLPGPKVGGRGGGRGVPQGGASSTDPLQLFSQVGMDSLLSPRPPFQEVWPTQGRRLGSAFSGGLTPFTAEILTWHLTLKVWTETQKPAQIPTGSSSGVGFARPRWALANCQLMVGGE